MAQHRKLRLGLNFLVKTRKGKERELSIRALCRDKTKLCAHCHKF